MYKLFQPEGVELKKETVNTKWTEVNNILLDVCLSIKTFLIGWIYREPNPAM